ncbi:variant surface glycoprotein (VSG), putative [Trypanosoma equiperdum]|uniref:Variant surface glycoprotein (VSG), putative n=1 Tax=Trypanosoma equiperdum TaxID=5694 RepID=A0A1G4I020_TRYEQ|nr:variant surface glycoprotein (VSG), putative [Trypanosoma equiperdum]
MAITTQLQIATLIIQLSLSIQAAVPKPTEECTDVCKCISRAKKRLNVYQTDLKHSQTMQTQNLINYHKLMLAAKIARTDLKQKIAPVIAGAAAVIDRCESKLGTMRAATQDLTEGVEQLTRSWKMLHALTSTNLKFKVTAGAGNAFATVPGENTLGDIADLPCPAAPDDEDGLTITPAIEQQQPELPKQDYTMVTTATCDRDGSSNSCHNQQVAQNGYWQIQMQAVQAVQVALSSPIPGTTTHSGVKTAAHKLELAGDLQSKVNANFTKIKPMLANTACALDITKFDDVSNNPEFERIATKALLSAFNAEEKPTTGNDYDRAIEQAYGNKGEQFQKNVWQEVDKQKGPISGDKKEDSKTLDGINTISAIGDSVARLLVKELKNEQEEKNNHKVNDVKEKECSNKKGDECKNGCKEITENGEKKCVVDKEEARRAAENEAGTDGKTTNTTGSNSFVINKAPLWLAVLIF